MYGIAFSLSHINTPDWKVLQNRVTNVWKISKLRA